MVRKIPKDHKKRLRVKTFLLFTIAEERHLGGVRAEIKENGTFASKGSFLYQAYGKYTEKRKIRVRDRLWMYRNIPSSIAWKVEIHHDWKDGARMYLLTKGEHVIRHRNDKKGT